MIKLNGHLQSRKFWLVIAIFCVIVAWFILAIVMKFAQLLGDTAFVAMLTLAKSLLETIVIAYICGNVVQKVINIAEEGIIGKVVDKIFKKGKKNE